MEVSEQKLPENPFYVGRHSLIRIVFLAADDTQANELWFLGSAIELQEELFLDHCRQVRFDLGDEIHFRQLAMKIVAIESAPFSFAPACYPEETLITYYVASSDFPLM